jgi:xylulose-5-phosphate/fructose-6-phosphate phosphoketolase
VLNDMDRFHLVEAVIDRLPQLGARAAYFKQAVEEKLIEHKQHIEKYGDDMPELTGWRWSTQGAGAPRSARRTSTEGDNV